MKAPSFRYLRPRSLHEACRVLAEFDGEAMPLAGGQSLLAALNLRLSSPQLLIDVGDLRELAVSTFGQDGIRLAALTRHAELLGSNVLKRALPLLPRAAAFIGHAAIRNRGTLGGSLAFADPAAELPACAVALDATILVARQDGQREAQAEDFFTGLMETTLQPGELIIGVQFPPPASGMRYAVAEFARRHGDFAVAGIAIAARVERDRIAQARAVYFGCVDRAKVAKHVSAALKGLELGWPNLDHVIEAVGSDLTPDDTPGWRADTKLKLARTLTRRAVQQLAGATE